MSPRLTTLAQSLPATVPFVGPETQERQRGRAFRARLGANENGFGPSPKALKAITDASGEVWHYGDPENELLKSAISQHFNVAPKHIAIGEGIDGLLGLAVRLYMEPGATVVTSIGAYPTFNYHVTGFGGHLHAVPYSDDQADLDALLAAVRAKKPAMVYLANPDNPMGTFWDAAEIEAFANDLPENVLFVLDEAYGEFATEAALPDITRMRPNMLRFRTFSKAYGLAGMRVGMAIGPESLIAPFDRVRNHFGMSILGQAAACAAIQDQAYLDEVVAKVARARDRIAKISSENGLTCVPSKTNFVAIDCGKDGAFAAKVMQELINRDIFVRKPAAPGLDRCIRVSTGPDEALDHFASALPLALAAARS